MSKFKAFLNCTNNSQIRAEIRKQASENGVILTLDQMADALKEVRAGLAELKAVDNDGLGDNEITPSINDTKPEDWDGINRKPDAPDLAREEMLDEIDADQNKEVQAEVDLEEQGII